MREVVKAELALRRGAAALPADAVEAAVLFVHALRQHSEAREGFAVTVEAYRCALARAPPPQPDCRLPQQMPRNKNTNAAGLATGSNFKN